MSEVAPNTRFAVLEMRQLIDFNNASIPLMSQTLLECQSFALVTLVDAIRRFIKGPCKTLIKYSKNDFEFKGVSGEISAFKFSVGSFKTETKVVEDVSARAAALDRFQYYMCNQQHELDKKDPRWNALYEARAKIVSLFSFLEVLTADDTDSTEWKNQISSVQQKLYEALDALSRDMQITYTPAKVGPIFLHTVANYSKMKTEWRLLPMPSSLFDLDDAVQVEKEEHGKDVSKITFNLKPATLRTLKKLTADLKPKAAKRKKMAGTSNS
jgi:hypothetical protein